MNDAAVAQGDGVEGLGMGMKQVGGVWLPLSECHLVNTLEGRGKHARRVAGRGTYQLHKLEAAMPWVKDWRTAVDVGAHVGLWSMNLAMRFSTIEAFEPVAAHQHCYLRNMTIGRWRLHPMALGAVTGHVAMENFTTGSTGDTRVTQEAEAMATAELVPMRTLDSFAFADVDFIKLDCEGYELFALQGGEETLARCKPCVVVEQKPGRGEVYGLAESAAVTFLEGMGATVRAEISGDFILSWD